MTFESQSIIWALCENVSTPPSAMDNLEAIRKKQDYKELVKQTISSFVLDADEDSDCESDPSLGTEGSSAMWPQFRQGVSAKQTAAASTLIAFDELSHLLTTALQQPSIDIRSQNWYECRKGPRTGKLLYKNMKDFFKKASAKYRESLLGSVELSDPVIERPGSKVSIWESFGLAAETSKAFPFGPEDHASGAQNRLQSCDLDSIWAKIIGNPDNELTLTDIGSKVLIELYPSVKTDAQAVLAGSKGRVGQTEQAVPGGSEVDHIGLFRPGL